MLMKHMKIKGIERRKGLRFILKKLMTMWAGTFRRNFEKAYDHGDPRFEIALDIFASRGAKEGVNIS